MYLDLRRAHGEEALGSRFCFLLFSSPFSFSCVLLTVFDVSFFLSPSLVLFSCLLAGWLNCCCERKHADRRRFCNVDNVS